MDGSDPLKHRLNLWLKSEQAMGLPSVPRVEFAPPPAESARPKPSMPATPPRQNPPPPIPPRSPQVTPQGTRQTDWFGAPPSAPAPTRASTSASAALPLLDTPFEG